eukprot:6154349-Pyramimonas_sp.AAC.1
MSSAAAACATSATAGRAGTYRSRPWSLECATAAVAARDSHLWLFAAAGSSRSRAAGAPCLASA